MKLRVLYFAKLREQVGAEEEELTLPQGAAAVADVKALLRGRGGVWAAAFGEGNVVKCAVNRRLAKDASPLADGAEVAFFPPLTGG